MVRVNIKRAAHQNECAAAFKGLCSREFSPIFVT